VTPEPLLTYRLIDPDESEIAAMVEDLRKSMGFGVSWNPAMWNRHMEAVLEGQRRRKEHG